MQYLKAVMAGVRSWNERPMQRAIVAEMKIVASESEVLNAPQAVAWGGGSWRVSESGVDESDLSKAGSWQLEILT
jgi:hypothetical protein